MGKLKILLQDLKDLDHQIKELQNIPNPKRKTLTLIASLTMRAKRQIDIIKKFGTRYNVICVEAKKKSKGSHLYYYTDISEEDALEFTKYKTRGAGYKSFNSYEIPIATAIDIN